MTITRPFALIAISATLAIFAGACAKKPAARTTVQVSSPAGATPAANHNTVMQTNIAVIEGEKTLARVADSLGLEAKWGMDKAACINRLKGALRVETIRGTDLLGISVDGNEDNAADIANAVASSYRDLITENGGTTKVMIHELAK
jgi:capsular polysaccharide biosynthesis protein